VDEEVQEQPKRSSSKYAAFSQLASSKQTHFDRAAKVASAKNIGKMTRADSFNSTASTEAPLELEHHTGPLPRRRNSWAGGEEPLLGLGSFPRQTSVPKEQEMLDEEEDIEETVKKVGKGTEVTPSAGLSQDVASILRPGLERMRRNAQWNHEERRMHSKEIATLDKVLNIDVPSFAKIPLMVHDTPSGAGMSPEAASLLLPGLERMRKNAPPDDRVRYATEIATLQRILSKDVPNAKQNAYVSHPKHRQDNDDLFVASVRKGREENDQISGNRRNSTVF
jgi:hypothetical protein